MSISSCTVFPTRAQETVVIDVKQSYGITLGGLNRALDSARYSGVCLLIWLVGSPTFHDSSSLWLSISRQLFSANPDTVVTLYISPGVYKLNYSRENDTVDFSNIKPGINIYSYLSEGSLLTRKSM